MSCTASMDPEGRTCNEVQALHPHILDRTPSACLQPPTLE